MKLRLGSAALAVAVVAPLLLAGPASAKKHDDVDADALAALKAAIVASDEQFGEQGGTYRASYDGELLGEKLSMRMLAEVDARGAAHLRINMLGLRQEIYVNANGKPVAVKLTGQLRRALTKHGLRHAPSWYVPAAKDAGPIDISSVGLADGFDALDKGVVALSATTSGSRTTYQLTTSTDLGDGASLRQESTIVTDHDLVTRIDEGRSKMTLSYGHEPIVAPRADRTHRKLIEAESELASFGSLLDAVAPSPHRPRATRVKSLRNTTARLFGDGRVGRMKTTVKDVPGGVRVTATIKSWKHPLAWRYTVTKKGIATRPVRTV